MPKINLKHYYDHIEEDMIVEITEEEYTVFKDSKRKENALERQMYRYHGQYSLDADDGTENEILKNSLTLCDLYELKTTNEQIHKVIDLLPEKQARRIRAYFFDGMSQADIANAEGVSKAAVSTSISESFKFLEKNLKKFLK